jgi:hypothetical protein
MALDIADPAAFEAVVTFAEREGRLDDLGEKLRWLDNYGGHTTTKCVLSAAPPPYAFDLVMFERNGKVWRPMFVGRLVYQTPDTRDGHTATPSFAVSITSTRNSTAPSQPASA